jgi:AraC family transcriptional regulator
MPTLSIARRDVAAQPFVFVRSRVPAAGIPGAIGEGLGKAFGYLQKAGLAPAGPPVARYPELGEMLTIESGVTVSAPAPGEGDVQAGTLANGPVLVGLHAGAYDTLRETYAAMERWAAANGTAFAGAPWESYLTDPGNHPDPADWRTEVYWPLAR